MIEWFLIFTAGVLGSFHCLGMCGPIAISLGAGSKCRSANLRRQLVFSGGRLFTYCVLGVSAGFLGGRFAHELSAWVDLSAILAIAAGILLCLQGLALAGVFARRVKPTKGCVPAGLFANFLRNPQSRSVFIGGMFTGMLPCGLVYGVLALAASSQGLVSGAVIMGIFGLGTVPMMLITGIAGSLLSHSRRGQVLRFAAWTVTLAGTISIVRGMGFLHFTGVLAPNACPLCR